MKVSEIANRLGLEVRAGAAGLEREVTGGYAGDMLSYAMAAAQQGELWLTLQGHVNIVAIASLGELAGIVVTESKPIADDTVMRANEEGIPILTTPFRTYEAAGRLWELGVRPVSESRAEEG